MAAIVDQIDRIKHDPESLPPEQRNVPGGPASLLIDHPQVIDVLHEAIGADVRLEGCGCVWRTKGERHGELHGGGPQQADPIFGYRVKNGLIHAGMVSYKCPAGSAVFFTENLCHAGPVWEKETPRIAILHAYSHLATHWHRLRTAPEILAGLPREKQAYFREP